MVSSMVNQDLLSAKLAELFDRLQRVKAHVPDTLDELRTDRDALGLVAFNLMLSVQTCADIASHLIADEGWPAAGTLGQSIARLEEHGVISSRVSTSLQQAVGLRNVVAHGYAGLDVERCFAAASTGLSDLEGFAREVSAWARRQ
jgi:uncharacterized protein YutE (UPF0331/DUF86 family)